jgi:hypothetical protein
MRKPLTIKHKDQFVHFVLALVDDAAFFKVVAIRRRATAEASLLNHLPESCFGSYGGFLAFSVGLPEADVVCQAIRM